MAARRAITRGDGWYVQPGEGGTYPGTSSARAHARRRRRFKWDNGAIPAAMPDSQHRCMPQVSKKRHQFAERRSEGAKERRSGGRGDATWLSWR